MKNKAPIYKDFIEEDPTCPGVLTFAGKGMAILDIAEGFLNIRKQIESFVGLGLTDFASKQAGLQAGASYAKKTPR